MALSLKASFNIEFKNSNQGFYYHLREVVYFLNKPLVNDWLLKKWNNLIFRKVQNL